MRYKYFVLIALFLLALLKPIVTYAGDQLTLYSYHQAPPFITGAKTGLTYDFANYLSQLNPELQIKIMIIPRKRLDLILSSDPQNIIIPWVSPAWFKKNIKNQYTWSSEIMPDASVYIWNNDTNYSFVKPRDLLGHNLGGIRGYRYINVDPLVSQQLITRSDANNEKQLIQMLQQHRVDVGIMPFSAVQYLLQETKLEMAFSMNSHHQFSRHLMINSERPIVKDQLSSTISNMKHDQRWQNIMRKYGLVTNPQTLEQATR